MDVFSNKAKWIRQPGACLGSWQAKVLPAPFLRRVFSLTAKPGKAKALICGLGYHELYLNGRKVGDHVLDPAPTQYDRRALYVVHDVSEHLKEGENVVGVVLGNGWFNCHTPDVWHFDKASWRDYPKLLFQLETDGEPALFSDETWKSSYGPIVFDGLRNGETYDARLELGDWLSSSFDDSAWKPCVRVSPPGGILREQLMPPCKVVETIRPVGSWRVGSSTIFDFGQNISGWCRIKVAGSAGTTVRVAYGERLSLPEGSVDQTHISKHVPVGEGRFQTDRYILKGDGEESWEPRFAYHGFQYAQFFIEDGKAEILSAEARFVCTSFERIGSFSCSDETVNRIYDCALRSFKSNFVGIPTDCPHREKNGWTGDAQLASDAGLCNFDAGSSYAQWLDSFADVQRPSGQLPGIVPSAGWGFNWGSGPAWDSAFLIIAWNVYLYSGDLSIIKTRYEDMKRYVDYCSSMADDMILRFGLGDWCPVDWSRMTDISLTSTAYWSFDVRLISKFAALLGLEDESLRYAALADTIKNSFNAKFRKGGGVYGDGGQTSQACALYFDLVESSEKEAVFAKLVEAVERNGGVLDFGILGAKWVPRVLAENGRADLAFAMIVRRECPGWGYWIERGASTLWESWIGSSSLNHIMFGDVAAWFQQHLAGLRPDPGRPGFERSLIKPCFVEGVAWARTARKTRLGEIEVSWRREGGGVELSVSLPEGASAGVFLPDGRSEEISSSRVFKLQGV